MGLIRIFRRLVFAQVLMGIVAFCLAEQNPGMLLLAGALGSLAWYVVEGPTGRPLPPWAINLGALLAVAMLVVELNWRPDNLIIATGHFTMWLQILELYAKKSNRDYGLVLVLSLLQMVGASVLSASIVFGALLGVYCVLSLFTVLVFHLKSTSDFVLEHNRAASPRPDRVDRPAAVVGRGHRWQFRLTALAVGLLCATVGVVVFLLTPRSGSFDHFKPIAPAPARPEAGFSREVNLNTAAPTVGAADPVLHLTLTGDTRARGAGWLLRGAALDHYDPARRTWRRSAAVAAHDLTLRPDSRPLDLARLPARTPMLRAHIVLRSPADDTLFSLQPTVRIHGPEADALSFNPLDQQLTAYALAGGSATYTLDAPALPTADLPAAYRQTLGVDPDPPLRGFSPDPPPRQRRRRIDPTPPAPPTPPAAPIAEADPSPLADPDDLPPAIPYASGWSVNHERIALFARQVLDNAALSRRPDDPPSLDDYRAAAALAAHLQSRYTYSTDSLPPAPGDDPIARFLFESRHGHCEIFASALAAMTRSLGMRARVVTGYLAAEYNAVGGYYVVRRSHAHAWVEVDCGPLGWCPFDATPPDAVREDLGVQRSWHAAASDLFEHLEFLWLRSVVAYDRHSRQSILQSVRRLVDSAAAADSPVLRVYRWITDRAAAWQRDRLPLAASAAIVFFILVGVASLIRILVVRRRRLAALQLTRLPGPQRRALARDLRFYLQMLDLLDRHGHVRPHWQSPFDFAQELAEANPLRFDPVVTLTEHFYEVRFGRRALDDPRRQIIRAHLRQLEDNLLEKPA